MKDWVKSLLELQSHDMRIKKMNKRLKDIPKEKIVAASGLDYEKKKVEAAKEILKASELELRQVELKIESTKSDILKSEAKSAMVKKNDEYKALLNEIAGHKAFISSLEAKQIVIIDQVSDNKKKLETAQKLFKNAEREVAESIEELDEMAQTLDTTIKKALDERKPLTEKIDGQIKPAYNRLIKRDGEPLTMIHNNTCGSCHLKLTPQTINDSKKGIITTCDSCGHLIYYPDNE